MIISKSPSRRIGGGHPVPKTNVAPKQLDTVSALEAKKASGLDRLSREGDNSNADNRRQSPSHDSTFQSNNVQNRVELKQTNSSISIPKDVESNRPNSRNQRHRSGSRRPNIQERLGKQHHSETSLNGNEIVVSSRLAQSCPVSPDRMHRPSSPSHANMYTSTDVKPHNPAKRPTSYTVANTASKKSRPAVDHSSNSMHDLNFEPDYGEYIDHGAMMAMAHEPPPPLAPSIHPVDTYTSYTPQHNVTMADVMDTSQTPASARIASEESSMNGLGGFSERPNITVTGLDAYDTNSSNRHRSSSHRGPLDDRLGPANSRQQPTKRRPNPQPKEPSHNTNHGNHGNSGNSKRNGRRNDHHQNDTSLKSGRLPSGDSGTGSKARSGSGMRDGALEARLNAPLKAPSRRRR